MKRGKWEITLDMLKCVSKNEQCKKTRIMQEAHLDWNMLNKYLNYLVDNSIIKNSEYSKKKKFYSLSEKGNNLLENLLKVKRELP